MAKVQLTGFQCERCEHIWVPRDIEQVPTVCPKCKSPYWNKPRRAEAGIPKKAERKAWKKAAKETKRAASKI